jgi:MFS family permease
MTTRPELVLTYLQMLVVSVGLVIPQIMKQWNVQYPSMLIAALYAGSLVGAIVCGYAVDYVGRKIVWQVSLFIVTIFTMVAASSPNFAALAVFIGLQTVGAGGNSKSCCTTIRARCTHKYSCH